MPELSIIFVNFNDNVHLGKSLLSLEKNAQDIDYEVIIVDNNSTDGSQEFIKNHFPSIKFICNEENLGFAKANNQGIRESKGEYILLLNTDTSINPGALRVLLQEMRGSSDIGGIGPALLMEKDDYQVSFGRKINFFSELLQKSFLNTYYKMKLKRDKREREVNWLSGACLLIKKSILKEVGLFDENFFLYFEDIDLCLRIRENGWRLVYLPQAEVFHSGGGSTKSLRLTSRFHYRKSQLYFYEKHNSKISVALLRTYLRIYFLFLLFGTCFSPHERWENRKNFFILLKKK